MDYSEYQQVYANLQFEGEELASLVAHEPDLGFLRELLGGEMQVTDYVYARCDPGFPGVSLHTDGGMPYGSKFFGFEVSVPVPVRVLYYPDDLTTEVSPFRIVARSHLSMDADANPYLHYESHPEEVMVTLKAGSAVVTNYRVLHGNYPNTGDRPRAMLAISYRPVWAGLDDKVEDWDPDVVAGLPEAVRPFFSDRNMRYWAPEAGNKPEGMKVSAFGINPSRWNRAQPGPAPVVCGGAVPIHRELSDYIVALNRVSPLRTLSGGVGGTTHCRRPRSPRGRRPVRTRAGCQKRRPVDTRARR